MWRALLLLAVLASRATAQPIFISGFDGTNTETTNVDSFEFTATDGGTDARIDLTTSRVHDTANGGDSSSRWAAVATIGSATTSGFYKACIPTTSGTCGDFNPHETSMGAAISLNVDTAPTAGNNHRRTVLAMMEDDGDYGCAVALNPDRTLTLFYAGGDSLATCTTNGDADCTGGATCQGGTCRTTWGTTTQTFQTRSCTGNVQLPCTAGTQATDCPSASCSGSTFYWGGVELIQTINTTSTVTCELYVDGRAVFTGTSKSITGSSPVAAMRNVAAGIVDGPGTPNATATVYVDDFVVDDADNSARPGYGYVARKVPTAATSGLIEWAPQSCADHVSCVNDYDTGTFTYNTSTTNNLVQKTASGKIETLSATSSIATIPAGASITAVEGVVFGNTSTGNGLRDMSQSLLFGSSFVASTKANTVVLSSGNRTAAAIWDRYLLTSSPVPGHSGLAEYVQGAGVLGHQFKTGTGNTDVLKVGALLEYVRVRKADPVGSITLVDHNKGAEDGLVAVYGLGDSTLTGVHESTCIGGTNDGTLCTQASYCSWDPDNRAKPTGGCGLNNTICRSCTGQRQFFNAGGGLQCTADADCDLTCVANLCNTADGPTSVPCSVEGDCTLGTCDTTATCIESCPSGQCPVSRVGWIGNLGALVRADDIISCGQDGEQISEMYGNRFQNVLDGQDSACIAVSGSGVCTCNAATDCAAAGGACTNSRCTAGDSAKLSCTRASDCANGFLCAFPPPDYLVTLEGYNEMNPFQTSDTRGTDPTAVHQPNCDKWNTPVGNAFQTQPPMGCPTYGSGDFGVAVTACIKDSDCSAVSPYSLCAGWCMTSGGFNNFNCRASSASGCASCATSYTLCSHDSDCTGLATSGSTCDGEDTRLPDNKVGVCRCASDGECPTGYKCVGDVNKGLCRKICTNGDSDCKTAQSSSCVTTAGASCSGGGASCICQGRCTLPCDAVTCTDDSQCAPVGGSVLTSRWANLTEARWTGTCNRARGRCANCGITACGGAQVASPCSCSSNTDCGGGGACTNNVCTAGTSTRTNCQRASDCAAGFQCLRPDRQFQAYRAHVHLPLKVAKLMQATIDGLGERLAPVLLFITPPNVAGLTLGASTPFQDAQCRFGAGFSFYDRDFLAIERQDFLAATAWLPRRHVVDPVATWEAGKERLAYHADQVHFATVGSGVVGSALATSLNALNACVKSDGSVQKYCQNANGSFASSPNNGSCTTDSDCSSGAICVARACNGNEANCPLSTDNCNPD